MHRPGRARAPARATVQEANELHHPAPPAAPRATRRATAPTSYHQQHQHRPRRQQHHEHGQRRGGRELIDIPQRSGTPYRTGTAWTPPKLRPAAYTALQGQHLRAARITRAVVPYFSECRRVILVEVTFSAPIRSRPGGISPPVLLCSQTMQDCAASVCKPRRISNNRPGCGRRLRPV